MSNPSWREIDVYACNRNPFALLNHTWTLIAAADKTQPAKMNMMTASWGGLGILWNQPVATVYIRPQRHTKTLVDAADGFSLSFLPESYRAALQYCGKISGRDEDKCKGSGLTPVHDETGGVWFAEAELVLLCRKLYVQELSGDCFADRDLLPRFYPENDLHTMYVGAIQRCLVKEE